MRWLDLRMWSVRVATVALVASSSPNDASAQPLREPRIAAFVGGGFGGIGVARVPHRGFLSGSRYVDTGDFFMVGAAAEVGLGPTPVRLRVGGSRTLDADLVAPSDRVICGIICRQIVDERVGAYETTTAWVDFVVDPFSWTLSPYGFAGVSYSVSTYRVDDPALESFFDRDRTRFFRHGFGLDLQVASFADVWAEVALGSLASTAQVSSGVRIEPF